MRGSEGGSNLNVQFTHLHHSCIFIIGRICVPPLHAFVELAPYDSLALYLYTSHLDMYLHHKVIDSGAWDTEYYFFRPRGH